MRTEHYISAKLEEWNNEEQKRFLQAYNKGDWDTVYSMTKDLTGGAYTRQIVLFALAEEITQKGDNSNDSLLL